MSRGQTSRANGSKGDAAEETDVVVIDLGSGVIKAGFSGEFKPRLVFESVKGDVNEKPFDDSQDDSNIKFVTKYGRDLLNFEHTKFVKNVAIPFLDGKIHPDDGKEHITALLKYTFEKLQVNYEETNVLISDAPNTPLEQRNEIVKILFETFKVRAVAVINSAVLSLFSTGLSRGLVVEVGHESTSAVPIFEGFPIPHATFTVPVGGKHISAEVVKEIETHARHLKDKLKYYEDFPRFWIDELKATRLAVRPAVGYPREATPEERVIEMLDGERDPLTDLLPPKNGSIENLPLEVRYNPCEVLFKANPLNKLSYDERVKRETATIPPGATVGYSKFIHRGSEWAKCATIQEAVSNALNKVDSTLREDLLPNIVLGGGTSCIEGLAERLRDEVVPLLGEHGAKVEIIADRDRGISAWRGGSMLASLPTFSRFLLGRKDYDEAKGAKVSPMADKAW